MSLLDELYITNKSYPLEKQIAFNILHNLMDRSGFDDWFGSIDEDIQIELIESLIEITRETVECH